MELLKNQLVNTDESQSTFYWPGGTGTVFAEGTFDGAILSMQCRYPNGEWMNCGDNTTFSATGVGGIRINPGAEVRGNVITAGASTDVTLRVM